MLIPVDSRRFLATDTSHTQLFLCSLGQGVVHMHPLLPVSNRRVGDVVVNPTRSLVAFVATDAGGQQQLYVSSLSALNSMPRQLTQFAGIPGNAYGPDNYGLLAWQN
jgi:Tol biopolymer transport system component